MKERRRTVRMMPGETSMSATLLESWQPYVWRDPRRCSPDRLAELAAHDDYIRALEDIWGRQWQVHRKKALL